MAERAAPIWPNYFLSAGLRRAGLLVLSISALLFYFWLAQSVQAGSTLAFDTHIRAAIHRHNSPALTWFMRYATHFGAPIILSAATIAAVIFFIWKGWYRAAVLLLVDMVGVPFFNAYLKTYNHRMRPSAFFGVILPTTYSFPSGHALSAFCFYGMVVGLLSARINDRRARFAIWLMGAILTATVGISRVYLGVHYPSDVIGGYAAALVWVSMLLVFDQNEQRGDVHSLVQNY